MLPRYLVSPSYLDNINDSSNFIIIGSGIAGLSTAIKVSKHTKVKIFTKSTLSESNTWYAQGGIAASIKSPDNWEKHYEDTIKAGQGLCDSGAVKMLVQNAPVMIEDLIEEGVVFDIANGEISLTLEGGHSQPRILHSGGDATGEEIERKLITYSKKMSNIEFYPENFVLDILTENDEVFGIISLDLNTKKVEIYPCPNVLIATGGVGQLFELTTNPPVATGDGIAMAYRAGAEIKDIEFVQFHPTVFKTDDGKLFLISEALRGEGAYLRDIDGDRFMLGKHPLVELAPRDIVVKEMIKVMKEKNTDFVYLDATHLDRHLLNVRFPNIVNKLKENNLDLKKDLIKVSPAAHYLNGGIKTNLHGETNIKGLYACGEAAATGAHGANRLASNSLMEGLVFGTKIYESISAKLEDDEYLKKLNKTLKDKTVIKNLIEKITKEETKSSGLFSKELNNSSKINASLNKDKNDNNNKSFSTSNISDLNKKIETLKQKLRHQMTNRVGILREEKRLKEVLKFVDEQLSNEEFYNKKEKEPNEFLDMLYTARLIINAAIIRKESRGTHQRCDYPNTDDENWKKHIIQKRDEVYFEPVR